MNKIFMKRLMVSIVVFYSIALVTTNSPAWGKVGATIVGCIVIDLLMSKSIKD